jgi:transcriptional regulator with XRE-family HTH domain
MPEELEAVARRIAGLRAKLGWTQQELADRLAISRVAVSHLEAGMTAPSERTVVLLAGLFKVEPLELVAGTSYPVARAERLPLVAARYTEAELLEALLDNDLAWLERTGDEHHARNVLDQWDLRLHAVDDTAIDPGERALIGKLRERVRARRR